MSGANENTSDIFLLRLWSDAAQVAAETKESQEGAPTDMGNMHGRLLHLMTGSAHNFDNLPALLEVLRGMLSPSPLEIREERHDSTEKGDQT
jgi:hypothetical protein